SPARRSRVRRTVSAPDVETSFPPVTVVSPWVIYPGSNGSITPVGTVRPFSGKGGSGVDVLPVHRGGVAHDELAAGRHLAAHQQVEDALGLLHVLDPDPAQDAVPGVHRGLGELVG